MTALAIVALGGLVMVALTNALFLVIFAVTAWKAFPYAASILRFIREASVETARRVEHAVERVAAETAKPGADAVAAADAYFAEVRAEQARIATMPEGLAREAAEARFNEAFEREAAPHVETYQRIGRIPETS